MLSVGPAISEPDGQLDTRCIQPTGGGPSIRTNRVALRQLEFYIRTGVNAIRGRGVEVGGLILGHPIDWNEGEVVITGFIPVEIEYRFGPTFRPSEADVTTFREAAAEEDGNIIGYYRSQLRDGPSLREEDHRLLTELFPKTDCCFARAIADSQTPTTIDLHKVPAGAEPVLLERFPLKDHQPAPQVAAPLVANGAHERISARAPEVPVMVPLVAVGPVAEALVAETPIAETTVAEETPVAETLVPETLVAEMPVAETLVAETPVAETPAPETLVAETPVAETPVVEDTPWPAPPPVPQIPLPASPAATEPRTNGIHESRAPNRTEVPIPFPESGASPAIFVAWNSKRVLWVAASVIAVLAITAVAYTSRKRSAPKPIPLPAPTAETLVARRVDSRIGLEIIEHGPQIEIRWDAASPFVRTAVRGRLTVRDASESLMDLDLVQVRSGSYSYKPVESFLTFAMTIYQADGSFTDETTTVTREFHQSELSSAERPSSPRPLTPAKQPAKIQPLPRVESNPPPSHSNPPQPVVPAVTNARRPDAQPTPILTETPQPLSGEQAVMPLEPARAFATVDPPAVNAVAVPVLQPPTPPSPTPEQVATPNTFVGPQIIHQAVPAIPLGIAPSIRGAVQVEVRVALDATGKVSRARVVSSTGAGASLLTIEALKAAQLCRFTAAQENGHPVPSSMVLTFRFTQKSK